MRTTIQHTSKIVSAAWLFILILSGCGQTELEGLLPASDDSSTGEPVELRISLADSPEYNNETTSTPATRSGEPLIGEWVKVNSFSATRSAEEYEGPAIAAMELFEDSVSCTPQTRANMATGYYFRLIAFKKVGTNNYVYQSAADYTANGVSAPVLKQGKMILPIGQTYRFVAYSFNNASPMGDLLSTYTWNSTSISIPNLSNDFMTFDSGDKVVSGETFALPVSFTHQLCKLTVKITATGFDNNTFSNCTGVYIKQGGNSSSWTVGASAITAYTDDTAQFDIPNNNTTTSTRLVPFANARPITVHFGTLSVGGKNADNTNITSSQSVKLLAGKSYTMTVQFKKKLGIQVPSGDINLGNSCTDQDKTELSKLTWADGNLKSTGGKGSKDYVWTTTTDYGYYYTWYSAYTGSTSRTNSDPCSELIPAVYGTGWCTPSYEELKKLARCTDKVMRDGGMWYMNNTIGLFLPAAGLRSNKDGSGINATNQEGNEGNYWSTETSQGNGNGQCLTFNGITSGPANYNKAYGLSVRCVKRPV